MLGIQPEHKSFLAASDEQRTFLYSASYYLYMNTENVCLCVQRRVKNEYLVRYRRCGDREQTTLERHIHIHTNITFTDNGVLTKRKKR